MIGQILRQRYKIIQQLGVGGFCKTYLAEDLDIPIIPKPKCVVKQLKLQAIQSEIVRLFEKEGEILYRLGQSYNQIPKLFAYFEQNSAFYLIQEFIDGQDLGKEIIFGKQLSEAYVMEMLCEVLEILVFVHQNNVIHRDVKPPNIMRCRYSGKLMLIDFGAVKEVATISGQTSHTVAIGTLGYMPSEQAQGKPKLQSDVYALGMTAIQALTGIQPHLLPTDNNEEVIWQNHAQVSETLAEILNKMVRYDFRQRYADASEVLQALNQALGKTQPRLMQSSVYPTVIITPSPSTVVPPKRIRISDKCGYINTNGEIIISLKFDEAWDFSEGLAKVKIGSKHGWIDTDGKFVIPCQFDEAWNFSEGLAGVAKRVFWSFSTKWGFIDTSGQFIIYPQFDDVSWFSEGLAPVKKRGKWGFINTTGQLVIAPQFNNAYPFREGKALVETGERQGYIIDKMGRFISELLYDSGA
ncbi:MULTISPECIES: WG repeat-containing protein [unclassified Nostoc]|uniref:WG repeat-containing protein n=1 Tax=unclassified Nostoc TaxID=2593658 RepID=UPI002AD52863|nr:WG repeat-containing protein [Nostoc sp. DedQUE03]MDZ7975499.1 WG repeat-containing protein [Nostoc sp. DedQUE03]MDZ8045549.1 WG repeat-containing protein [Nostoc sp. DedQUE02]